MFILFLGKGATPKGGSVPTRGKGVMTMTLPSSPTDNGGVYTSKYSPTPLRGIEMNSGHLLILGMVMILVSVFLTIVDLVFVTAERTFPILILFFLGHICMFFALFWKGSD